jgi:hypothetical protein
MEGLSKLKMAVPLPPVRDLVSFTSGTHGSSTPLMNCMRAASQTTALRCSRSGAAVRLAVKGLGPAGRGGAAGGMRLGSAWAMGAALSGRAAPATFAPAGGAGGA